jgi:hypothetical protein
MTEWVQQQNSFHSLLLNPVAAAYITEGNVHIFGAPFDEPCSKTVMAKNKVSSYILE